MPSWRDSIPSKWLKAADLEDKPHLVTITKFSVEDYGDKKGPAIWFQEFDKALGLNITNGNKIEEIMGSGDPAKWTGRKIVVFPTTTEYHGEEKACIRVRAPKPGSVPAPVEFRPSDEDVPF